MTIEIENGSGAQSIWLGARTHGTLQADEVPPSFRDLLLSLNEQGQPIRSHSSAGVQEVVLAEHAAEYDRQVARKNLRQESMPLHENIGNALAELRASFADAGMPIIDMVKFDRTATGEFRISGWGKGEAVSHPQGKFIEDVLNGRAPGFEALTKKAHAIFDKIEGWHSQIQDVEGKVAELYGEPFVRSDSIFADSLIMTVEHLNTHEGRARVLIRSLSADYAAFRTSLGDELGKLTERQVMSRFYYKEAMVPDLGPRFEDYV